MNKVDDLAPIIKKLQNNEDYRESWRSTIALAFYDKYMIRKAKKGKNPLTVNDITIISDEAAEYFLKLLCHEIKFIEGR